MLKSGAKGGGSLMVGGWSRHADPAGCAVIDCTGTEYSTSGGKSVRARNETGKTAFAKTIATTVKAPALPWLDLPIQDYGIPGYQLETWQALAKEVLALMDSGISVLVCCQGGHGRSGMVSAILCYLIAPEAIGQDPVAYIRKTHCEEAVDTLQQHKFVNKLLGLEPPDPKPYEKAPVVYGGACGGGYYQASGWSAFGKQDNKSSLSNSTFIPKPDTVARYGRENANKIAKYLTDHVVEWRESKGFFEVFVSTQAANANGDNFTAYNVMALVETENQLRCHKQDTPSTDPDTMLRVDELDKELYDDKPPIGKITKAEDIVALLSKNDAFVFLSGDKPWCYIIDSASTGAEGPFEIDSMDWPRVNIVKKTSTGISHTQRHYSFLLRKDELYLIKQSGGNGNGEASA